jgi:hypothetical protein
MSQRNITNFVYRPAKESKDGDKKSQKLDEKTMDKLLQSLATQSMREKAPSFEELEGILSGKIR